MNKTTLKILLGLLAFLLAGCAGFFSITGLSMLFAGAALPVIIMAGTLEFSKLVAASFLYQYWKKIGLVLSACFCIENSLKSSRSPRALIFAASITLTDRSADDGEDEVILFQSPSSSRTRSVMNNLD
jgi:hypothetical protein